ncbi:MAG: hypothetical protein AAFV62_06575 [Pseudomonadota bacterium]
MELIADGVLIGAALTAALYCWVLARRLRALNATESGLGGAIAGLSARVDQTRESLRDTKATTEELASLLAKAERVADRLEQALASQSGGEGGAVPRARRAARVRPRRADPPLLATQPSPTSEAGTAKPDSATDPVSGQEAGGLVDTHDTVVSARAHSTPLKPLAPVGTHAAADPPGTDEGPLSPQADDIIAALRRIADGRGE